MINARLTFFVWARRSLERLALLFYFSLGATDRRVGFYSFVFSFMLIMRGVVMWMLCDVIAM